MPREKMSDAERAAHQHARAEKKRIERETAKAEVRAQITAMASQIPEHVRRGGVQTVQAWKAALDKAIAAADLSRVSLERLTVVSKALRSEVER